MLAEVIACFPVYRSYVTAEGSLTENDRKQIRRAIDIAKLRNAALSESTFDFLQTVLLLEHPYGLDEAARAEQTGLHAALSAVDQSGDGQELRGYRALPLLSPGFVQ